MTGAFFFCEAAHGGILDSAESQRDGYARRDGRMSLQLASKRRLQLVASRCTEYGRCLGTC